MEQAVSAGFIPALFQADTGLWGEDARAEASIRLGWVKDPAESAVLVSKITALREEFMKNGVDSFVLCGMGGSSLAPEVMAAADGVSLAILDTTHPDVVHRMVARDLSTVAVVVSSKSGGTVETDSQRRAFEAAFQAQGIDPSTRIVVVTDPGSPLHVQAKEAGYRTFLGDAHVGGRFSALTAFGLVPSGLAGVNLKRLLDDAHGAWSQLQVNDHSNPALVLGALLSSRYPLVNKILLGKSSSLPGFGDWVEQLVAESTGKNGHGMLPVVGSNLVDAPDCVSVGDSGSTAEITITGTLGEQMFLWLVATTFASKVIGVNPFDQPNVESAKVAARALLDGPEGSEGARGEDLTTSEVLSWCQSTVTPRSYLALCVFGDTTFAQQWSAARSALEATINRPVTLGLGPQFLHSTGQFHKGGPLEGVFLQVIQQGTASMEVPGRDFDFGQLMEAQADGDSAVLTASTQPTKTVVVSDIEALDALFDVLLGSKA